MNNDDQKKSNYFIQGNNSLLMGSFENFDCPPQNLDNNNSYENFNCPQIIDQNKTEQPAHESYENSFDNS